jgi:trimeric autotransporter adhesin
VNVSAEIKDGSGNSMGSIGSGAMTKPGTDLYGVDDGADPLTVVVPSFSLKSIQQSTPVSGATNTLTVSLTANFNLATGSTVTITGLTGSQTADSASLPVSSASGLLGVSGAWTQSTGELVLTAAGAGTVSGTACEVTFNLTNTDTAQVSPGVNVSAEIKDGSGNSMGSIGSGAMTKPGTDLYGVDDGADPLTVVVPSFSLKSIQQSTPVSGATNTLTVSLTANFNLATGSTVTITGLTGSQTADSASLPVSSASGLLGVSGAWTQSTGELVLTAAGAGTVSGTACEVTFNLTNTDTAQVSPGVNVSAEIKDGSGNSMGSIGSGAMTKPGTDLYGVDDGADPLTVVVPSFSLKSIQQSTPVSGATNTLTVSLTANFNLATGSTVTITGLTGSQTADSASLPVSSASGLLGVSGAWTQSTGELVLTAAGAGTVSGTACEVTFNLTNTDTAQVSPGVNVSAEIKDGSGNSMGSIGSGAMTKPGTDLYGVDDGADPLTVVVPSFSLKSIQQSTPVSGATNTLTVSLTANFNLATGSTVTITGLTGSQTADSASLPVSSASGLLGVSGAWTQSTGELVLTAAGAGTVSGTACEVTFNLTNTDTAQVSPGVNVSAEIKDGSGNSMGSIGSGAMTKPGTALYGVSNGADPLTVVVPSFSLKSIQQSTPVSGATNNMLTVSLTANFNLATGSTVTITGLTGSQTVTSASLTVSSTSSQLGTSGAWTQSPGELVLTASGGTTSETACVVTFTLTNTATAQSSPAVSVSAVIKDGSGTIVGSIASAAMAKPGTALYGVSNGADPLTVVVPSFSLKSIQQSTPVSGATNNMLTVSLTANFNLATGSTVTITGLTGSQTADSASLPVSSASGLLGVSGAWTQSTGELVLTAAGAGTVSGTACEVTFNLTNTDTAQVSPGVNVSAEIKDGSGNSMGSIGSGAMTKPGTDLYGVDDGADPLTVVVPSFSLKSIQQSTPVSGATNTLTVSLTANFNLATGSTVTITGLTGSQTADSASLPVSSASGLLGVSGAWTQSTGELVLTAAGAGTVSGTACEVTFNLTNTDTAQVSPGVNVSAEIKDGSGNSMGSIGSGAMTKPGTDLYGVDDGADPLTVVVPSFSLKSIQQSTPVSGATNTLTVSLTANFNLATGSTVTITGLTGSQTADSASLPVSSASGLLGVSGAWTQSTGELVLTAAGAGTVSGTACEVTFNLTNTDTAQVSPGVNVSAEIKDGSGNSMGSIGSGAMTKPGTDLYGVDDGADPLTVVVPSFSLKSIQQSTPVSGATNTLTVSLTANFNLATGSTVTITGLTGSQTADSASLPVSSASGLLGVSGAWTQSTGELVLTAAGAGTVSGTACEVTFNLTNTDTAQVSPGVNVSAEIKDGSGNSMGSIGSGAMTKPGTDLYGVDDGADPLTVVVPSFSLKSIQQSTPVSGATNTLTVSLTANFNLATGSTVTITGLTGSQTADSASLPVSSASGLLGVSGAWTQSTGELVLTAAGAGTVSGTACEVTFNLTNTDTAQVSPGVNVSAEIKDGSGNSMGSIGSGAMTKPGTDLYGVDDGADPLTVVVPSFSLKSIQQSTPVSGATNTLTVSLTANFNLATGSTVTITGLTGSQTADSASLPVSSASGLLGVSGAWTQSTGELVLTAAGAGTVSGTACEVTFNLTNTDTAQVSPGVNVSAEIKDGSGNSMGSIGSGAMTKPGTDLYGVDDGADPLTVSFPCRKCPAGKYLNSEGNDDETDCVACVGGNVTSLPGSTSILNCVCLPGFVGSPASGIGCTVTQIPFVPVVRTWS